MTNLVGKSASYDKIYFRKTAKLRRRRFVSDIKDGGVRKKDMKGIVLEIRERLFSLRDEKYKDFQCKLIPTIAAERVIGIRVPVLRAFAKRLSDEEAKAFLAALPHEYYDENNLHAFLIERISDYEEAMRRTEEFLPHIDNWATCDLFSPKVFRKHPQAVYEKVLAWLQSKHPYTVRYGIGALLKHFLDEEFRQEMLDVVASVRSEEYYVKMMVAWYFATALIKQREATLPVILERRLEPWTHNKAIQKAIESRRIDAETKSRLRSLKIR